MQLDKPINRVIAIGAISILTLGLVGLMSDLQSAGNLGMAAIFLLGKRTRSSGAATASDLPPGLRR
jgi:hypothetical protein